jgi:hypothetical protein
MVFKISSIYIERIGKGAAMKRKNYFSCERKRKEIFQCGVEKTGAI